MESGNTRADVPAKLRTKTAITFTKLIGGIYGSLMNKEFTIWTANQNYRAEMG